MRLTPRLVTIEYHIYRTAVSLQYEVVIFAGKAKVWFSLLQESPGKSKLIYYILEELATRLPVTNSLIPNLILTKLCVSHKTKPSDTMHRYLVRKCFCPKGKVKLSK